VGLAGRFPTHDYGAFGRDHYDALINFVGAGDPARVAQMGAKIVDVTLRFDKLAIDYVRSWPKCRYLFLSSGAVYGGDFERPADAEKACRLRVDHLCARDFYAIAKLRAEQAHRILYALPIVDIRVFSYFSRTLKMSSRFFIGDVLRAILGRQTLETSDLPMIRDFLHPRDFSALISSLLGGDPINAAIDCYTVAPVEKCVLLSEMRSRFGLSYQLVESAPWVRSLHKQYYYSLNRQAAVFGYQPAFSSIQCVLQEASHILEPVRCRRGCGWN
jgi:nucleoside-diphosphate-sugar epimerase